MLVAFKQLVPEHAVALPGSTWTLRVKDGPLLAWVAVVVGVLVVDGDVPAAVCASAGVYAAWFYLRFVKVRTALCTQRERGVLIAPVRCRCTRACAATGTRRLRLRPSFPTVSSA
jgi:hypothetical protein